MFNFKTILAGSLLSASPFMAFSQYTISGKVVGKDTQEIIAGATIRIDNSFITSQSRDDGSFEIKNLKAGIYVLHVSMLSYERLTDTINLTENKIFTFQLQESMKMMEEVIVAATRVDDKSA